MVKKIGVMISMPEGPGFKSRSGQIAYFHGVKTRLSTLGTGDVPRGSDSTYNSTVCLSLGDIKERLESPLPVLAWGFSAILGIRLGLHWTFRTLDKPFGFLVLKPSGV